jgi:hypothetical protein
MRTKTGSTIIEHWPEGSREAARLVIDTYGEPHEATKSLLVWNEVGPWKRMLASREFHHHDFPAPHIDCVESVLRYRVPLDMYSALAAFDGSVIVERTAGEVSARCHDEQANNLALNLMHDIVTRAKTVDEARNYYANEFLDYRRGKPTPYMNGLRFNPATDSADADTRVITEAQLAEAVEEGKHAHAAA